MSTRLHDPEPAFEAHLQQERARADRGDIDGAADGFELLWREARGRHVGNELRALSNLCTAMGRAGRYMETLLLARHHASLSHDHGDAISELVAWGNVASALSCLGAAEATRRALPTLEALTQALEGPAAVRGWSEYYEAAVALALMDKDADAMEVALRAYAGVIREGYGVDDPTGNWVIGMNEAEIAVLRKAPDVAEMRLDRLLRGGHTRVDQEPEIDVLRARIALLRPPNADREAAVMRAIASLEALARNTQGIARRIPLAMDLARDLGAGDGKADSIQQLHELAAEAIVLRMGQLEDAYERYQGMGVLPNADDAVSIGMLRLDFSRQHNELLDAVARHLTLRPEVLQGRLLSSDTETASILVCAWCKQVCTRQGNWIPIAHFLPRTEIERMTHGICPTCHSRIEV